MEISKNALQKKKNKYRKSKKEKKKAKQKIFMWSKICAYCLLNVDSIDVVCLMKKIAYLFKNRYFFYCI